MLRILLIDDEKNTRDVISTIVGRQCSNAKVVGTADSVQTGIAAINELLPDLVLLDIHLQDGSGFDILKACSPVKFKVVFITAYEEYALKAFKFSALDYILKPVHSEELVVAVNKAAAEVKDPQGLRLEALAQNYFQKSKESKKIVLKTSDSIYSVSIKDILHCQADTYYTKFFLNNGQSIMVSGTLKDFDEMLEEFGFFRVHQSHLINMDYFVRFKKADGGFAVLKDGTEVPVASRKKDLFLQAIANL